MTNLNILRSYYKEYKPANYLFEGQFGGRYSLGSAAKILSKAIWNSKFLNVEGFIICSIVFAIQLLEAGTDLLYIRVLLVHNSSKTIEIYTHVSNKNLQQIKSSLDDIMLLNIYIFERNIKSQLKPKRK